MTTMSMFDNTIPSSEVPICHGKYKGYVWYLKENISPTLGIINGYVMIKPHQDGYNFSGDYEDSSMDCYGGITFVGHDKFNDLVIGFDTNHGTDYVPKCPSHNRFVEKFEHIKPHHWTKLELKHQCTHIIDQLIHDDEYNH